MSILSGSLDLNGNIAISENISFTTSGSGVIQTLTTLGANGTASYVGFSNTTASLNFGLNLIDYAASQDYCVKLPQPVTGKSVKVPCHNYRTSYGICVRIKMSKYFYHIYCLYYYY